MAKKAIKLTDAQLNDLKKLAKAQKSAEEAKEIRTRLKSFTDDNEAALREGIEVEGLVLGIKFSKQLTVEEIED